MLKKFVARLEDPNHPLLGPTLCGLQSWGMWQPNGGLSRIICNLIHLAAMIIVVTQYIELWFIRTDLNLALKNFSLTMLTTICVAKAGTFIFWQSYWQDVIQFVSTLEISQLEKKDKTTSTIIESYTKYSRKITYFYWGLITCTSLTLNLTPLGDFLSSSEQRELMLNGTIPLPVIVNTWVPFEKTKGFGYWFQIVEHTFLCAYGGGVNANYDANTVALLSYFCGQLKILLANSKKLFSEDGNRLSYSESMERIKQCHMHHLSLIKYSKILNSLLSPVMFLYFVICSLMICVTIMSLLAKGETTTMQRMFQAEYLTALVSELFLYCWHSNEVYFMSESVDRGIYESEWWQCEVGLRRCVLLLGGQLRKTIIFEAGPFITLTVATFISILRGTYSFYTLLSKNEG